MNVSKMKKGHFLAKNRPFFYLNFLPLEKTLSRHGFSTKLKSDDFIVFTMKFRSFSIQREFGKLIFEGVRAARNWKHMKKWKKLKKWTPPKTFNIDFSSNFREAKDAELNFLPLKSNRIWAATPRKKVMAKKPPKF